MKRTSSKVFVTVATPTNVKRCESPDLYVRPWHRETAENLCRSADTVGHLTESVPSLTVSEKLPPAQRFDVQAADRRSPIQVLTQRKAA